jgi:uncharacterized membrane-anchored protein
VRRLIALLAGLAILAVVNFTVYQREQLLTDGRVVLLELAPVDPRSLMQGDYMALRFRLADQIDAWRVTDARPRTRTAPLHLDDRGVATLATDAGSVEIAFRVRRGQVWLGTNAYFFEEGTGDRYDDARFGEFRIERSSGEAVLVGLRDGDLNPL